MQMQWDQPCAFQPDVILAADVLYDPGELHWQLGLALWSSLLTALMVMLQIPSFTQCLPLNVAPANQHYIDTVLIYLSSAEAIPSLIQLLKSMLIPTCTVSKQQACQQCTAYIVTTLRNRATLQLFLDHADDAHLYVEDISSQARQSCVRFQHHVALETQRSSIFVHKIKCRT